MIEHSGRPIVLDLYCKAGGAAMGYYNAGYDVVGVDIEPQPRYPFPFVQADAIEYAREHWRGYAGVHASPPCQAYTPLRALHSKSYPQLVQSTREVCAGLYPWYVLENVPGAPLIAPIVLCGTMFGLTLYRHRLFESNRPLRAPEHPQHRVRIGSHRKGYNGNGDWVTVAGHNCRVEKARAAMQIPWMTGPELAQAIPPAYTEYLGRQLSYPQSIHTPPPRSQSCR